MKRKKMNLIAILSFMLISIFYLIHEKYPVVKQDKKDTLVPVIAVHDGDTVSVILERRQEKVRLIGIDAPEIGQRPWGEKAKEHLKALLSSSGWKVKIEFDVEKRDKYGRILAYLRTSDGKLINLLMIKSGHAMLFTFPPNIKFVNELRVAQREARERKLGIWSEEGLKEKPVDYRKEHPRI
jgi:micrococcal nuclease